MTLSLIQSAEVTRRLEEREVLVMQLQRTKTNFSHSMEELKKHMEEESKVRAKISEKHAFSLNSTESKL